MMLPRLCKLFTVAFTLALIAACAPVDSDDTNWVIHEDPSQDDSTSADDPGNEADPPQGEHSPPGEGSPLDDPPQVPVTDLDRDCPDFHLDDPREFDFELYRYLACRRAPDQSLIFSPVLARIALAEAAKNSSEDEATQIANLLGEERLQDLLATTDTLRESLLARRPIPGITANGSGQYEYDFLETDHERLQEALGFEFYSSNCDPECSWSPQNQRWTDKEFHFLPPPSRATLNQTHSLIFRGQAEDQLYSMTGTTVFHLPNGERMEYPRDVISTPYGNETDLGHVNAWRLLGGQLSLIIFRPNADVRLASVEEELSRELMNQWTHAVSSESRSISLTLPRINLEEQTNIGTLRSGHEPLITATRLSMGESGLNSPNTVETERDFIVSYPNMAGQGAGFYQAATSPFVFALYDHDLDAIILLGRLARPH